MMGIIILGVILIGFIIILLIPQRKLSTYWSEVKCINCDREQTIWAIPHKYTVKQYILKNNIKCDRCGRQVNG